MFVFAACTPATEHQVGQPRPARPSIKLLPKSTMGVMAVDVTRAMGTDMAAKALQDPKSRQQYDEFVAMTGIDPMKDISYFGFGIISTSSGRRDPGRRRLHRQSEIRQGQAPRPAQGESPRVSRTEAYNGIAIYSNLDGAEAKQTTRAAFLDASHIVAGSASRRQGHHRRPPEASRVVRPRTRRWPPSSPKPTRRLRLGRLRRPAGTPEKGIACDAPAQGPRGRHRPDPGLRLQAGQTHRRHQDDRRDQGTERQAGLDPQRLQGPRRHGRVPGTGRRRGPRGDRHPLGRRITPSSTSASPRSSWTSWASSPSRRPATASR
ncbi:MAG: hypothetical protein M0C28_32980 [Candidatus Moduliflexus flocculans]|nr:hypothetical protein [Candidatus Moduliflexus flocculans]